MSIQEAQINKTNLSSALFSALTLFDKWYQISAYPLANVCSICYVNFESHWTTMGYSELSYAKIIIVQSKALWKFSSDLNKEKLQRGIFKPYTSFSQIHFSFFCETKEIDSRYAKYLCNYFICLWPTLYTFYTKRYY